MSSRECVIEDYLGQGPKQRRDRWSSLVQQRLVVVDDFKAYNDAYGHQEGDYVLRKVALAIVAALRVEDVASRYGGEEFKGREPERVTSALAS